MRTAAIIELKTPFLHATFSADTGNLLSMHAPWRRAPLVTAAYAQYVHGPTTFSEDFAAKAAQAFEVVRVDVGEQVVASEARTPHLLIRRRFECAKDFPFLKVAYTIQGQGAPAELQAPQLPHVRFAEEFLSVIEGDERDLFCDGAELGRGRQLPCWRVFFLPGHQDGLMVAARSKLMMSHMQIWARLEKGIEFRPHLMCSYSSDYDMFNRPIPVSASRKYEVAFEIGPWQAAAHARLLRMGALGQPEQVTARTTPRRKFAGRMGGKILRAADIAPARAVSREYHRHKWLVTSEAASRSPKALFANGGCRPPLIACHPKLKGLHRIFVGVGTASTGMLKLSGEPETRYRHAPGNGQYFLPFALHLGARTPPVEIDFGVAKMDGQRVTFGMPPTQMVPGLLDYIRFEKLSLAQAKRWRRQELHAPRPPLSGFADTYDIGYVCADAKVPSTRPYRANVWSHKQAGFQKIFWRIDGACTDFPTRTGTMRPISCWAHNAYEPHSKAYSLMLKRHDLLKAAVRAAHDYDIELWGWMRFNSYFSGAKSEFFKSHPEYWETSESGRVFDFKLCMAFEETRRHKINILTEAAQYGLPGLSLGFLRHPPILHYHPVMAKGYLEKFGKEPPRNISNQDFFQHLNTLPESDPEHARWYRYRAEFMTQFGRDLRQTLAAKGMGHVKVSIWVRPQQCLFDGIDIEAWLDEKLCDEVVAGPYPGDQKLMKPTAEWKRRVQSRVPLIGGINCSDPRASRTDVRRLVREGYDGICTYECNDAVTSPQMIEIYRDLRKGIRAFAPD